MPKWLLDVFGQRMHLEGKVAAADRVEKVEADRELIAEARMHRFAKQRARLIEDQDRATESPRADRRSRAADCFPPARNQSTSRSSSAPRSRSQTSFIHWPPHGAGIEKRDDAERPPGRVAQAAPHRLAVRQLGRVGDMRVEDEVPSGDEGALPAIAHPPVDKEGALVLQAGGQLPVLHAEIVGLLATVTELALPAREIGVDQDIRQRR